jgi:hypothetical protein
MVICLNDNCNKHANFNVFGLKPLYCSTHKETGMLDVVNKRCAEIDCDVIPSFNFSHEKKPIFCFTHKTDGMLDIKTKRCIEIGCITHASFNYKGEKKKYCKIHKKENMINISKKCSFLDCDVTPGFNFSHEKKPIFCVKHKNIGMIRISDTRCIAPECKKSPCFNLEGEQKALYCSTHKKDNMIDIKNKNCIHECCKVRANFNFVGEKKTLYCFTHKKDNMIDIKHQKCIHECCLVRPNYNYDNEVTGIYCTSHKLDTMVDVINTRCLTPLCFTQPRHEGYCMRCFMYTFPDKPVARNYKTKEFSVVDYITKEFPEYVWITDKIIQNGCSKKRPDLLLDLGYQVIIVEIDENQHKTYDCSCDNKRVMELSQDVGHRPIVFIRFNPDDYMNKEGQKVKSCWSTNGNGINIVSPKCKNEWETRLENLKEQIEYWTTPENKTDKTVEVVQLYYDEKI